MTVRSSKGQPFDVTLSFPFADLTDRPVSLTRSGQRRTLDRAKELVRSPDAPSYVYVRGVRDGDTIMVGQVAADARPLRLGTIGPPSPARPRTRSKRHRIGERFKK